MANKARGPVSPRVETERTDRGVRSAAASTADRVERLLGAMTLEQKVGQMTQPDRRYVTGEEVRAHHIGSVLSGGGSCPGANRPGDWLAMADAYWEASASRDGAHLGIPILYGVDAIHGHNNVRGATVFPHNIGLGAAGDPDLVERIARVTAIEVLATGVDWTFAPTLAVVRDDRWGRAYEGYSEDPEIVARFAGPMVRGLQGDLGPDAVVACAKHWVGDGGTLGGVDQGETVAEERELRRLHVEPYRRAVEAGVLTVMASYSSWNGVKCHGHRYLLTDLLKGELGFRGLIVSDWDAVDQLSDDYGEAVARAANAGVDLFMVPEKWPRFIRTLQEQVQRGAVPEARVDDAVRRILSVKAAYGLFDRPRPAERRWAGSDRFGSPEHRAVAREAVRKSLVLLENHDGALPLLRDARILVTGKNAHDLGHQCGGFTIEWQGTSGNAAVEGGTSIWEGIRAAAPGAVLSPDGSAEGEFDVAVVVIGETPYAEGMGDIRPWDETDRDRVHTGPGPGAMEPYGETLALARLHPEDLRILERMAERGIPVVTVLVSGRPLVVNREIELSAAFVAAWLPGSEGGGVADVLFGDYDFTGRLSFSWPARERGTPNRGNGRGARYPYGYGLTYR